jgi:hypothetical protein
MTHAFHILSMLPADMLGPSAVPAGQRVAEGAILAAIVVVGLALVLRARLRG